MLQKLDWDYFHPPVDNQPIANKSKGGILSVSALVLMLGVAVACLVYYATQTTKKSYISRKDDVNLCVPLGSLTLSKPSDHQIHGYTFTFNFEYFKKVPDTATFFDLAFKASNGSFVDYLQANRFHWFCLKDSYFHLNYNISMMMPPFSSSWITKADYIGIKGYDPGLLLTTMPLICLNRFRTLTATSDGITEATIDSDIDTAAFNYMKTISPEIEMNLRLENGPYFCTETINKNEILDCLSLSLSIVLTSFGIITAVFQIYHAKFNTGNAGVNSQSGQSSPVISGTSVTSVVPYKQPIGPISIQSRGQTVPVQPF